MIEAVETSREGKRPERTVYRVTDEGVDVLLDWLREIISRPELDTQEFVAAISILPHLPTDEVIECLQSRAVMLEADVAALEAVIRTMRPRIGMFLLLEGDLMRALRQAEWSGSAGSSPSCVRSVRVGFRGAQGAIRVTGRESRRNSPPRMRRRRANELRCRTPRRGAVTPVQRAVSSSRSRGAQPVTRGPPEG